MASLFIKDQATAERVGRFAARLGTTKTDAVRQALDALEDKLAAADPIPPRGSLSERMAAWRKANPLPPKVHEADKAFFDWLSGEEDVEDLR
jgi:antitoxin VapB